MSSSKLQERYVILLRFL